ncbi:MAG: PQQ-binding-like beta-propeller repeat protein [Planctomycetaceae bacterium]
MSLRRLFPAGFLGVLLLIGHTSLQADNWPSWRGPTNNGLCTEHRFPVKWSPTEHVAWKLDLPGQAGATPVVWDDRIFLTSVDSEGRLLLMAVSTEGKEVWRRTLAVGNKVVRGDEGNSASPSPVTDGKYVWAMMAQGTLACFDFNGEEIWKFNVEERYGKLNIAFGLTSSPVLDDGVLYLQMIHGEGDPKTREACVVALTAATGQQIWRVDRPSDGEAENEHSYASPIMYTDSKQKYLLTHGADYIVAHRLTDGAEIWRCGELNKRAKYDKTLRFVASPAAVPGLIVVPTAKAGPVVALRPDGHGDITADKTFRIWEYKRTPDVPSPVIHDGIIYLCMENGTLTTLNAETGKDYYTQRFHSHNHRASPVLAGDKLYMTARDGRVTVVKTGQKFELLAENDIDEDMSSSPAFSNGTIYLRTFERLWAIR